MKNKLIPSIAISIILIGTILIYYLSFSSEKAKKESTVEKKQSLEIQQGGFKGVVLVDAATPFIEFTQEDYEKALSENKIIILDFYADWCPICRGEAPVLEQGFRSLENPNVIGFRVNYNDSQTDDDENALAKKFAVSYQHTKVILKDGKEVLKDGTVWDTETFLKQVKSVL